MTEALIRTDLVGHVGELIINRPHKHNALNDEGQALLLIKLRELIDNPQVRCILLRGEGKSLCAGRDTSVLGQREPGDSDFAFVQRAQQFTHAMLDCAKPIVASIKGAAIGGGFEMALAADLRVVGRHARMSLPEIKYGLLPDMGGTQTLASLVGRSKAKYLVMTGNRISGEEAFAWGIADWLVEDEADSDAVDAQARQIASEIAANPPQALMMAKHLIDQRDKGEIQRGIRQELTSICTLFKSADYTEARTALNEGRPPVYTGL